MLWHRHSRFDSDEHCESAGEEQALRAALDELRIGLVLLDSELRATFINRAFRRMWRLSDDQADSRPAFVALMYHGRDTRAYAMGAGEVDAYIAERVALVRIGDARPIDLWLANGEVVRFQCTALGDGGRLLTYAYVTETVRQADELDLLRAALDHVAPGILLLDRHLNARFMNKSVCRLWNVDDSAVVAQPSFAQLLDRARNSGAYAVAAERLDSFVVERVAEVRAGDPTPRDLQLEDGRVIRAHCTVLPDGGRMLAYTDVTDLTRRAAELQRLRLSCGAAAGN
jgi:PAS domain-containing protein